MEAPITAPKDATGAAGGGVEHRTGRGRRSAGGAELTRIIGGVAGGRRIAVPPRGTRPTTDRVRESLFNIVAARLDLTGLAVLDLYAGSGALGLEALSRGAASALFVESDPRTAAIIARNIEALGLPGATLRRGAVAAVLAGGRPDPGGPGAGRPALRRRDRRGRGRPGSSERARLGARGEPSLWWSVPPPARR